MPTYKFTYFESPLKGRSEPIYFLFAYGGIDFIDDRIKEEDWPSIKPTMPLRQLPVLEVDGKRIVQSKAICRYLAKKVGLAGRDDWENLEIDATVDTFLDFRNMISAYYYEKDPEAKKQKLARAKEMMPFYMSRLDQQAKRNGGYLVNGRLTWADLLLASYIDLMNFRIGCDVLEGCDALRALTEKVMTLPKIKAWLDKHPRTYLVDKLQ